MLVAFSRSTEVVVWDILLNNDDLLGATIVFELSDIPFVVGLSVVEWLHEEDIYNF